VVVSVYESPSGGADRRALPTDREVPVTVGGPRVGLVVSKAVGNAVTRHAVSRKLRHVARTVLDDPETGFSPAHTVVLRALPASAGASSGELERDVRHALRRILGS
jgi:ribonuclease P protein component